MAYIIIDKCDKSGICRDFCPVDAISEGEMKYIIDPELCIDCGACVEACPIAAIEPPK